MMIVGKRLIGNTEREETKSVIEKIYHYSMMNDTNVLNMIRKRNRKSCDCCAEKHLIEA